jgi:uncharacterized repeat protein (TIGR03803 family)
MCGLLLFWAATTLASSAQTLTPLIDFDANDGSYPEYVTLAQGPDGKLYGTTSSGGDLSCQGIYFGCGTVFKMTPSGALTTLHSFAGPDGGEPQSGLVLGVDGNFYGVAYSYGANNAGTAFKITSAGAFTTLYNFCSQPNCVDGQNPTGIIQGSDGNFYGTTRFGGDNNCSFLGCGTVFKMTPGGTLTVLHLFSGYPNEGLDPVSGLIQGTDGNLYGTTDGGGTHQTGTVFKITPAGKLTVLYNFCAQSNCADGATPLASLLQGNDGNFYGTTEYGGEGAGTVFKMAPSGKLTTMHSFSGDGGNPSGALTQGTDGNFYGTTGGGGANLVGGTIFRITSSGILTTLYNFCSLSPNCADGADPWGGLVEDTNGAFYGATFSGVPGCGTLFSLSTGLAPFVALQATSGKEGTKVTILGQGFTSSSIVKFGGTQSATVRFLGSAALLATVPAGALTGNVTVTTGATKLSSNKIFRVIPQVLSFSPTSGPVGTSVTIIGTGLTQTLSASFGDSVLATNLQLISDTEITATVPNGAKTGPVAVKTKGGTGTSQQLFTVTP